MSGAPRVSIGPIRSCARLPPASRDHARGGRACRRGVDQRAPAPAAVPGGGGGTEDTPARAALPAPVEWPRDDTQAPVTLRGSRLGPATRIRRTRPARAASSPVLRPASCVGGWRPNVRISERSRRRRGRPARDCGRVEVPGVEASRKGDFPVARRLIGRWPCRRATP